MDITADKLELMTTWAKTASLPHLVMELKKTASLEIYAESNMEAVELLSNAIITRFNK